MTLRIAHPPSPGPHTVIPIIAEETPLDEKEEGSITGTSQEDLLFVELQNEGVIDERGMVHSPKSYPLIPLTRQALSHLHKLLTKEIPICIGGVSTTLSIELFLQEVSKIYPIQEIKLVGGYVPHLLFAVDSGYLPKLWEEWRLTTPLRKESVEKYSRRPPDIDIRIKISSPFLLDGNGLAALGTFLLTLIAEKLTKPGQSPQPFLPLLEQVVKIQIVDLGTLQFLELEFLDFSFSLVFEGENISKNSVFSLDALAISLTPLFFPTGAPSHLVPCTQSGEKDQALFDLILGQIRPSFPQAFFKDWLRLLSWVMRGGKSVEEGVELSLFEVFRNSLYDFNIPRMRRIVDQTKKWLMLHHPGEDDAALAIALNGARFFSGRFSENEIQEFVAEILASHKESHPLATYLLNSDLPYPLIEALGVIVAQFQEECRTTHHEFKETVFKLPLSRYYFWQLPASIERALSCLTNYSDWETKGVSFLFSLLPPEDLSLINETSPELQKKAFSFLSSSSPFFCYLGYRLFHTSSEKKRATLFLLHYPTLATLSQDPRYQQALRDEIEGLVDTRKMPALDSITDRSWIDWLFSLPITSVADPQQAAFRAWKTLPFRSFEKELSWLEELGKDYPESANLVLHHLSKEGLLQIDSLLFLQTAIKIRSHYLTHNIRSYHATQFLNSLSIHIQTLGTRPPIILYIEKLHQQAEKTPANGHLTTPIIFLLEILKEHPEIFQKQKDYLSRTLPYLLPYIHDLSIALDWMELMQVHGLLPENEEGCALSWYRNLTRAVKEKNKSLKKLQRYDLSAREAGYDKLPRVTNALRKFLLELGALASTSSKEADMILLEIVSRVDWSAEKSLAPLLVQAAKTLPLLTSLSFVEKCAPNIKREAQVKLLHAITPRIDEALKTKNYEPPFRWLFSTSFLPPLLPEATPSLYEWGAEYILSEEKGRIQLTEKLILHFPQVFINESPVFWLDVLAALQKIRSPTLWSTFQWIQTKNLLRDTAYQILGWGKVLNGLKKGAPEFLKALETPSLRVLLERVNMDPVLLALTETLLKGALDACKKARQNTRSTILRSIGEWLDLVKGRCVPLYSNRLPCPTSEEEYDEAFNNGEFVYICDAPRIGVTLEHKMGWVEEGHFQPAPTLFSSLLHVEIVEVELILALLKENKSELIEQGAERLNHFLEQPHTPHLYNLKFGELISLLVSPLGLRYLELTQKVLNILNTIKVERLPTRRLLEWLMQTPQIEKRYTLAQNIIINTPREEQITFWPFSVQILEMFSRSNREENGWSFLVKLYQPKDLKPYFAYKAAFLHSLVDCKQAEILLFFVELQKHIQKIHGNRKLIELLIDLAISTTKIDPKTVYLIDSVMPRFIKGPGINEDIFHYHEFFIQKLLEAIETVEFIPLGKTYLENANKLCVYLENRLSKKRAAIHPLIQQIGTIFQEKKKENFILTLTLD